MIFEIASGILLRVVLLSVSLRGNTTLKATSTALNVNTVNSKAYPFTVANLGVFETVFEPIRMKTSNFG